MLGAFGAAVILLCRNSGSISHLLELRYPAVTKTGFEPLKARVLTIQQWEFKDYTWNRLSSKKSYFFSVARGIRPLSLQRGAL